MSDYDSPWKEALEVYFEPFLEFFFPDIHADIDWGRRYEFLDKELQRIVREGEVGRRVVDKLAKVGRASGQKPWILMHVEVQTFKEADFARRMYVYHTRLFHRYNSEVASLAVLGDDDPHWRPYRYVHRLWGVSTEFTFPVAKLLDYAPQAEALEQSGNPFAAFVLAHLKTLQTREAPQQRLLWKVRLVKGL